MDTKKTRSDIDKYGLSVIIIEATDYVPSFAYSIGLCEKYNHPEIICFGLSNELLHETINNVADVVKDGQVIQTGKKYNDFFENGAAEFLKVDSRNLPDYFGAASNFYSSSAFAAIQLVWTDRKDKFPWETDFEEEFIFRQPLLDRNANFKFREEKNLATFTTRQWIELQKPILRVVHEYEGEWQFLTGDQMPDDIKIVALEQLILRDDTLNEIFDLGYGEEAERDFIGGPWTRNQLDNDEE